VTVNEVVLWGRIMVEATVTNVNKEIESSELC